MDPSPELREFLFRYDAAAPLHVRTNDVSHGDAVVRERISFAGINDHRVPALLTYDPATPSPRPVLLIQHGLHSSKDDTRLAALAEAWIPFGYACLTIDAPLHGERGEGEVDVMRLLAQPYTGLRFVVQNVVDLRRAVDLVEQRPDLDERRVAFVGFSMSAFLGVQFMAVEPRVRAAVVALGGAGLFHFFAGRVEAAARADAELVANLVDPLHFAPQIAPRPVLQVNSETDEVIPAALGHMLHGALAEPKTMIWFRGRHGEFPDDVIGQMRLFLSDALDVASAPSPGPSPTA